MKLHERLSSVFRTLQLCMITLIALGHNGGVLWAVLCVALCVDAGIDIAIREAAEDGK